jgi:hypothetical protein
MEGVSKTFGRARRTAIFCWRDVRKALFMPAKMITYARAEAEPLRGLVSQILL